MMNYLKWVSIAVTLLFSLSVHGELDLSKLSLNPKSLKKRKIGLTSKITHNKLEKAFRHQRAERYPQAIQIFVELLKASKNRPDEHAQIWQHLGFTLAQKGDTKHAIQAIESALRLNALPYSQTLSCLYLLAQLSFTDEQSTKALTVMRTWMTLADKPSPEPRVFYAQLLSQTENKEEALGQINQAILDTPAPAEKWLQFALALNQELGKHTNALKLLIQLTAQYPKEPRYWRQLGGTYLSLNEDKKALAVFEMAYKQGFIAEESELLNIASLYLFLELPRKASELLISEMSKGRISKTSKSLELLAQAHLGARERELSLTALAEAAKLSVSGDTFTRIGMLHLENENWDGAKEAFSKGLSKGANQPEKAYWGLAVAHLQKREMSEALSVLKKARARNAQDRNIASLMEQVKSEIVNEQSSVNRSEASPAP